jgi:hypothetical protein
MPLADRALIVGIDNYPGITPLSGAEHDALEFYKWVTSPAGGNVDPANATKLLSANYPAPASANAAEPARQVIEDFFTAVDEAAEANNHASLGAKAGKRLWLFFSGHGFAPSLDRSGVLTANATLKRVHNIAPRLWADRLYEGGWFDEVILFQDACRNRIKEADLNPPFLRPKLPSNAQVRRRFYAFAASNDKLAKEVPLPGGGVGGVFTATLVQGLRGGARDPVTGAITTAQLKGYLQANMSKLLSQADLENDDVAKVPDVFDPDPFDIVSARPGTHSVREFPVRVVPRQAGTAGQILDAGLRAIATVTATPAAWNLHLPLGLYKAVVAGVGEALFQVTGGLDANGTPTVEEVRV